MAMTKEENDKFWSQFHSNLEAPLSGCVYTPFCQRCIHVHERILLEPYSCDFHTVIPDSIYRNKKFSHREKEVCEHYTPKPNLEEILLSTDIR